MKEHLFFYYNVLFCIWKTFVVAFFFADCLSEVHLFATSNSSQPSHFHPIFLNIDVPLPSYLDEIFHPFLHCSPQNFRGSIRREIHEMQPQLLTFPRNCATTFLKLEPCQFLSTSHFRNKNVFQQHLLSI